MFVNFAWMTRMVTRHCKYNNIIIVTVTEYPYVLHHAPQLLMHDNYSIIFINFIENLFFYTIGTL